jgi:hypothetical protein
MPRLDISYHDSHPYLISRQYLDETAYKSVMTMHQMPLTTSNHEENYKDGSSIKVRASHKGTARPQTSFPSLLSEFALLFPAF